MDGFEFVFSLFGLLLGFSLVEVFAGFGRAFELRVRPVPAGDEPSNGAGTRVGWLSPLLGLFVIFNLISFWTAAWAVRDLIPVHYPALLLGLTVTGGYYFAATLVFPREMGPWPDLDDHYFQVKRWVVAVIAACNLLGAAGMVLAGNDPFGEIGAAALNLFFYAMLAALFFARRRQTNLIFLILLAAQYPVASLVALLLV